MAIGIALQNSQEPISIGIVPGSSAHRHSPRAASVHAGLSDFAGPTKKSFESGFVSAWSAKTARTAKLPPGVKRVRIAGLGARTKRNGFRVVAAEVETEDTSEARRYFHLLRIDDKLQREDYLSDQEIKELVELRADLDKRYPKFRGLNAG